MGAGEESVIPLDDVPDTFYDEGRENVLIVSDLHAMDEKPSNRLNYIQKATADINNALERYNSNIVVFNGDTGSADHLGAVLDYLDADQAIFTTGDEDRKVDRERNYIGWAKMLDREASEHFNTDIEYRLEGEHIRIDEELDLPGSYPVHVQHFPQECRDSVEETGFEAFWFSGPEIEDTYAYSTSPTMQDVVQVAIHGHTHGYDARQIGLTALISLGGLRRNYVTNGNLSENSLQAFSFGEEDFEVVHQSRDGVLQESQRFKETKNGFKLIESRGKDSLETIERYMKDQLPPKYLAALD